MEGGTPPPGDMELNNSNEDEARSLLQKLYSLQCSPELIGTISQLITDYKKNPEDLEHLIHHLEALVKEFGSRSEKVEEVKKVKDTAESRGHTEGTSSGGLFSGSFGGSKRSVKVYPIVTSDTCGADTDVLHKLKKHYLELIRTGPADCDVVLIFCVVLSRAGSDVANAMRRIPDAAAEKPVVLVVLHHKRKDDLPEDGFDWSFQVQEHQVSRGDAVPRK
ncbi:hypothetical protein NL108_018187 [Boleophthalmus pectinirostris]|nr:hypothetical protein NL108_018187 [Boleophthalmus pectinirostris]